MALLRLLSRAAFICNICFLIAIGLLYFRHPVNPGFASLIIVMGFFLSVVLNIIVNATLIYYSVRKKTITGITKTLRIVNGSFLVIQLFLIIS
jgi:hypothetical protein